MSHLNYCLLWGVGVDANQLKIEQSTMNSFVISLMDYSSDLTKKINVLTLLTYEKHWS